MLVLTTSTEAAEVELIPLFSIDGKEYGIPKEVDISAVLRALKNLRNANEMTALASLLEDLIGAEAYEALCNFKGLKPSQFKELMDSVSEYAMGQLQDSLGN